MSPAATTLPFSMMAKRRAGAACELDVLFDEDDREVLHPVQAQDHLFDFFDDDRLNAFGRLVEQQDLRLGGERTRDSELLLLPAGQHAAAAIEIFDQIGEQLGHEARDRASPVRPGERAEQNVLADGEVGNDLAALRHIGKSGARPPKRWLGGDIVAAEPNCAGRPIGQAHDGLEQRCLAGAVAAEDGR